MNIAYTIGISHFFLLIYIVMFLFCFVLFCCIVNRVPTGPYFREKSLFSIVALPALEKSLLLNIFDRSPGKVLIFNRCVKTWMINIVLRKLRFSKCCGNDVELFGNPSDPLTNHRWRVV